MGRGLFTLLTTFALLFCANPALAQDGGSIEVIDPDDYPMEELDVVEIGDADEPAEGEQFTTVVVGRRPMSQDRTADAVEVDGETLRRSPRASALEAVSQEAPDMYVSGRGLGVHGVASGASGGISVRGLSGSPNSQILVVEDGVPDYQGIFGHPLPDAYVPELIDEIRLVKGGDSVLYGSNALGGVLLIRSKVLEDDGFQLSNDASYGSFQTVRERISVLARRGDWDVASAFSVLRTDGHRDASGGTNMVGHVSVGWEPRAGLRIFLRDRIAHLEGEDPGPVTHPNDGHWYDVWRNTASLGVEYRRGRAFRLEGLTFFNMGVHRLYDGFYSEDYLFGGRVDTRFRLHETLRLRLGIGAEGVAGAVENRATAESYDVEGGATLYFSNQLEWRPLSWLRFIGGTREIWSSIHDFIFLYKAGMRLLLPGGLTFRLRVARNYREPTIRERYLPFPTANPDLRPEYSLNVDVGLMLFVGPVEIAVSGYRTWADDLIRYFGSWPSAEVVNIDHVEIYGIEAHLRVMELGPFRFFVGGNWQDVGRYTRQNPSTKYNFMVEATHSFGPHTISGTLSGEWVRGLYQENYSRDPIDDVFFLDLSAYYRYRFTSGVVLEPYLMLRNLTNNSYEYIRHYPMPGINALAGLRLHYAPRRESDVEAGGTN